MSENFRDRMMEIDVAIWMSSGVTQSYGTVGPGSMLCNGLFHRRRTTGIRFCKVCRYDIARLGSAYGSPSLQARYISRTVVMARSLICQLCKADMGNVFLSSHWVYHPWDGGGWGFSSSVGKGWGNPGVTSHQQRTGDYSTLEKWLMSKNLEPLPNWVGPTVSRLLFRCPRLEFYLPPYVSSKIYCVSFQSVLEFSGCIPQTRGCCIRKCLKIKLVPPCQSRLKCDSHCTKEN